MLYKSCSIDSVIGRIIRNTRVQDNSFIQDFYEWIPEAMGMLHTQQELFYQYKDIDIEFHAGKLPCGLIFIDVVEWNCRRLPIGNSVKNIHTSQKIDHGNLTSSGADAWVSAVLPPGTSATYWTSTIESCNKLPICSDAYYQIQMDAILTSFPTGKVRVHYRATATDARGLPLIPDNENYKEAIYCYTRAKMIGAGFMDRVYKESELLQRFELYGGRAIAEITYPSPDMMERTLMTSTRFIPPQNYYENFFRTDEYEREYNP